MRYSHSPLSSTIAVEEVEDSGAFELGYRASLDGIRGVSILVVMAFNAHLSFGQGGYLGVGLFFVLSGFLITSLLVREHSRTSKISLKSFYYRRALRLLPALFALILFVSVYAALFQPQEKAMRTWKGVLYTLFYVANWAQLGSNPSGIGALSHAWSLSVEEQFYILWPLLLVVLLRRGVKREWIAGLLLLAISASIAWSACLWHAGANYMRVYQGSDTRAGELLIGCLVALLINWRVLPQTKPARIAFRLTSLTSLGAILYAVWALPVSSGFLYCGGFALIACGASAILIDALLFPSHLSRIFEFQPLVWIGKVSYGLYLWHFPIFETSRQTLAGRVSPFIYEAARFGAVFLVAGASYYFLEKPFLRMKRRYTSLPVQR